MAFFDSETGHVSDCQERDGGLPSWGCIIDRKFYEAVLEPLFPRGGLFVLSGKPVALIDEEGDFFMAATGGRELFTSDESRTEAFLEQIKSIAENRRSRGDGVMLSSLVEAAGNFFEGNTLCKLAFLYRIFRAIKFEAKIPLTLRENVSLCSFLFPVSPDGAPEKKAPFWIDDGEVSVIPLSSEVLRSINEELESSVSKGAQAS